MSGIMERIRIHHAFILSAAVLLGAGCAHYPTNARLEHYDPQSGAWLLAEMATVLNQVSLSMFTNFENFRCSSPDQQRNSRSTRCSISSSRGAPH